MISKKSVIQDHTQAYIVNGNWTHYFHADSVTGTMLAFMCPPTGINMIPLSQDTTYNDLHKRNIIKITEDKPLTSQKLKMPTKHSNVITLYPDEMYTDGKQLLSVSKEISKYLYDDISYAQCYVQMYNIIDNEAVNVLLSEIHSKYTPKMSMIMYQKYMYGNLEEKAYMKAAVIYNSQIRKFIAVAEMIVNLNSSLEDFTDYLHEQFTIGELTGKLGLNIVGDYYINGDDIQYFLTLDDTRKNVILRTALNHHSELDIKSENLIPVSDLQTIVKKVWFKNTHTNYREEYQNNNIWSFYETLERVVIRKLYKRPKKLPKYDDYLGMQSRYPYYSKRN